MKSRLLYGFFSLSLLLVLTLANSNGRADGANQGNTGAPGDETLSNGSLRTCQTCHSSGDIQVSLDIEVSENGNLVEAYIPGQTYDVSVRLNHDGGTVPGGYGFQMVALNDNTEMDISTWSALASNVKTASAANTGRTYVEHNGVGTNNVFNMQWTAPAEGTGNVTFYACGNGVDMDGMTSGDGAAINSLQLEENMGSNTSDLRTQNAFEVYPNPVQDVIQIDFAQLNVNEVVRIDIIQANGQLIHSLPVNNNLNTYEVSHLLTGMYFLSINTNETVYTKRFVKQ